MPKIAGAQQAFEMMNKKKTKHTHTQMNSKNKKKQKWQQK